MKITITTEDNIFHIQLAGDLETKTFSVLKSTLLQAIIARKAQKEVWLDCSLLKSITTEAIEFLILYQHILKEHNINFLLIQLNQQIQYLFNTTQLDATLPVIPTKELAYYMYRSNHMLAQAPGLNS
ncbi:STAS domain-containing protein [Pontibacter qinzhouensis]|uniref:STAS domain-containing protein n=1 Tax=Pontibacter qinzhouensis TaxID=2603253 RepID=A0A5C8K8M0_9BACT|nr:STAS domain-containing protein [Pontibacter qinzhouensis]TXK49831.1 STAS domain-containing protein [Pontibacter qinzhouensis]